MQRVVSFRAVLCAAALVGPVAAQAQPQAALETGVWSQTTAEAGSPDRCPLITIAKGFHSGWGRDNPHFAGAAFVIRDPHAWELFWDVHTDEPVPPPRVDFRRHVVLAAIQGPQPTAGGPNIAIVEVEAEGPFTRVIVIDDKRPGPEPEVSNPFHIVMTCRERVPPRRSFMFQYMHPVREAGVVVGRVFAGRPDGEPVPLHGAHVALLPRDGEPRHAMSGLDGSYFFVNVEPGEYLLVAEHPEFEPAELPIEVPPGTLVAHNIVLRPRVPDTGAFVGRVLGELESGRLIPIPDALVRLLNPDGEVARTRTNREGHFAIRDVPPGLYRAVAEAEGWLPEDTDVEIRPGERTRHRFVLQPR